jgi:redox-regulated HSP33 family molecular chaperone
MLQALPKQEILELLEERGTIEVTCEICGARYDYDAFDTHALYAPPGTGVH